MSDQGARLDPRNRARRFPLPLGHHARGRELFTNGLEPVAETDHRTDPDRAVRAHQRYARKRHARSAAAPLDRQNVHGPRDKGSQKLFGFWNRRELEPRQWRAHCAQLAQAPSARGQSLSLARCGGGLGPRTLSDRDVRARRKGFLRSLRLKTPLALASKLRSVASESWSAASILGGGGAYYDLPADEAQLTFRACVLLVLSSEEE